MFPGKRRTRRSARVPLKVSVRLAGAEPPIQCEGETVVVSRHGALIKTPVALPVGAAVIVSVYLTGKSASARVVEVVGEGQWEAGIELDAPADIWGVPLPPDDWQDS